MATKKQMTEKELVEAEAKVIPLLMNEPSELIELTEGVKVRFKRPTLPGKYRYQVWLNKKLQEIGIDSTDTEADQEFLFYWNYFGLLNAHVVELVLPDDTLYEYDQKEDTKYKFLLEKYVGEEIYNKGDDESGFILDAINKFTDWQQETSIAPEELKNS